MTTSQANNDFEFVGASLRVAKRHVKLAEACSGVLILIAYTLIALTAVVLADHAKTGGLSVETRLHVRWIYAIGAVALLAWLAIAPTVRRLNDLFAARAIERRHPEYRNSVISALQLAWREELPGSMRSALASRAAGDLAGTDVWAAIDKRPIRRAATAVGAAAALFLLYAALAPKPIWPSIRRALGFELPAPTRTQIIVEEPPADFETLSGSPVRMVARITGRRPNEAFVRFSLDGGVTWQPDQRLSLSPPPTVATADPEEQKRWRAVKPGRAVQQSMAYQFVAGDARSEIRTLRVRHYPQVANVRVRCEYPDYTRLAPTEHQGGNVTAVIGTRVAIHVRTTVPAEPPLMLVFRKTERGRILIQPSDDGATTFEGRFRVEADDEYTIDYRDRYGVRNRDPIVHTIKAVADEPPRIELERPADGIRLAPDESMHLACRVTDDFGLTDAVLMYQTDEREHVGKIPLPVEQTNTPRALLIERAIPLSQMSAQPGQKITWWVSAQDNRHNARDVAAYQVAESEKRHIIVKAGEPGRRPGRGAVTSRRTSAAGPTSTAESSEHGEPNQQSHAGDLRSTSLPAGSQAKGIPVRAPGSQPADDLAGFVERHDRELTALEKHLESDSARTEQEGPSDAPSQGNEGGKSGDDESGDRQGQAHSGSADSQQGSEAESRAQGSTPSASSTEDSEASDASSDNKQSKAESGACEGGKESASGSDGSAAQSSEKSGQGQGDEGDKSGEAESGEGQGQAGTGSSDAKDGSEGSAEGQGSASSGESAEASKGSEASSGKGKGDSDAASEQDQKTDASGEGKGQGEGEGQGDGSASSSDGAGQGRSGEGSSQASKTPCASSGEGKGKGSGTSDTGGGIRDPEPSSDGTPTSLPTSRPQRDGVGDLAQTSQGGPAHSPTVDRAEKLVNELERQLRRGEVDPELLSDLKWTPEQAQQFVQAFREIEDRTPSPDVSIDTTASPRPVATRQPGSDRWQPAGGRDRGVQGAIVIDRREADQVNRLLETRRQQVGREYRPLLEAYYKTIATYRAPTSQPAGASR